MVFAFTLPGISAALNEDLAALDADNRGVLDDDGAGSPQDDRTVLDRVDRGLDDVAGGGGAHQHGDGDLAVNGRGGDSDTMSRRYDDVAGNGGGLGGHSDGAEAFTAVVADRTLPMDSAGMGDDGLKDAADDGGFLEIGDVGGGYELAAHGGGVDGRGVLDVNALGGDFDAVGAVLDDGGLADDFAAGGLDHHGALDSSVDVGAAHFLIARGVIAGGDRSRQYAGPGAE